MRRAARLQTLRVVLLVLAFTLSACGLPSRGYVLSPDGSEGLIFFSVVGSVSDGAGLNLPIVWESGRIDPNYLVKNPRDPFFQFRGLVRYSRILALTLPAGRYRIPRYEYYFSNNYSNGGVKYLQGYPQHLSFVVTSGKATYLGQIAFIPSDAGLKAAVSDQYDRDAAELGRVLPGVAQDRIIKSVMW